MGNGDHVEHAAREIVARENVDMQNYWYDYYDHGTHLPVFPGDTRFRWIFGVHYRVYGSLSATLPF